MGEVIQLQGDQRGKIRKFYSYLTLSFMAKTANLEKR